MTPERDSATGMFPAESITPGVYAADSAAIGVDLLGYHSATMLIHVGVGGIAFSNANKIEMVLTHSDDGATYVPVTDDDIVTDAFAPAAVPTGIVRAITAAKAAADVQKIGYVGGKRYLKLLADFTGAHGTGTPIAATIVRTRAALRGVA